MLDGNCVCVEDTMSCGMLLLTSKYAFASPPWKQPRWTRNFHSMSRMAFSFGCTTRDEKPQPFFSISARYAVFLPEPPSSYRG